MSTRPLPRRAFLLRAGRAGAGALCAGTLLPLAGCAGIPYARATRVGEGLEIPEDALGDAAHALVEHPDDARPIFVHRTPEGGYTAVSTRCAHRGCEVRPRGARLACPCHGSEYTLEGELLQGPAERGLHRFPVRVRNGTVVITLNSAEARP